MVAILIVVLIAAVLAIGITVGLYERELRNMAHLLRHHERGSNERISVEFTTQGIREVASAMNEELDALRDARIEQEKRQVSFRQDLSSLSHDIRTPLAGAQGYLQLYERTEDPEEQKRCLKEAAARLSVMRDLTDKLFEYAKAVDSDSPLTLERVEAFSVLAEVLAGMYPQFAERNWKPVITFEDEDLAVLADKEALQRVFSNLLTNALRYGVDAPCIEQEGTIIRIINAVADPFNIDADRMFDRFYQAETARTNDGSGLGLAIVASLVERMGGNVSARVHKGDLRSDKSQMNELFIELQLKPA